MFAMVTGVTHQRHVRSVALYVVLSSCISYILSCYLCEIHMHRRVKVLGELYVIITTLQEKDPWQ